MSPDTLYYGNALRRATTVVIVLGQRCISGLQCVLTVSRTYYPTVRTFVRGALFYVRAPQIVEYKVPRGSWSAVTPAECVQCSATRDGCPIDRPIWKIVLAKQYKVDDDHTRWNHGCKTQPGRQTRTQWLNPGILAMRSWSKTHAPPPLPMSCSYYYRPWRHHRGLEQQPLPPAAAAEAAAAEPAPTQADPGPQGLPTGAAITSTRPIPAVSTCPPLGAGTFRRPGA